MTSIEEEKVQYFLKLNIDFLEDLEKTKLTVTQRATVEELLSLSTEFYIEDQTQEPEETYDDGGIYGEIGGDDDVMEDDVGNREDIQSEGAKILNLHASYKGWLRDDSWFRSVRWWALIWRQKLLLYTDANTSENPSKTLILTKETKVTKKGSDKLSIEINSGRKSKKHEFKVESGDVYKWKSKLDEEINKSDPDSIRPCDQDEDLDEDNVMYDDMSEDIIDDESYPPASPEKSSKHQQPPSTQSPKTKKKIPSLALSENIDKNTSPAVQRFAEEKSPPKKPPSSNSPLIPSKSDLSEDMTCNDMFKENKVGSCDNNNSKKDISEDFIENQHEDLLEGLDSFPSQELSCSIKVPNHFRNRKSLPPPLPSTLPQAKSCPRSQDIRNTQPPPGKRFSYIDIKESDLLKKRQELSSS